MVTIRREVGAYLRAMGWFVLVLGVVACGRMAGDDGPRNLEGAKKGMEARVDAWCRCFREAQAEKASQAEQTTRCMNLLPGAKYETRMTESAGLNSAQAVELRSHAISYRRSVEKNCR